MSSGDKLEDDDMPDASDAARVGAEPVGAQSRVGLMCANPNCAKQIHPDPKFGGYCCKRCHWCFKSNCQSKSRSKKHGRFCNKDDVLPPWAPHAYDREPEDPISVVPFVDGWDAKRQRTSIM